MKLNLDCIRAVMLAIESKHRITIDDDNNADIGTIWFDELYSDLKNFSKEDIFYSLYNLDQAGYVNTTLVDGDSHITFCAVNYMTYEGHEFLEKIRDSKRWKFVKAAGGAVRNFSLDAINQIANGATSALIEAFLEQNKASL